MHLESKVSTQAWSCVKLTPSWRSLCVKNFQKLLFSCWKNLNAQLSHLLLAISSYCFLSNIDKPLLLIPKKKSSCFPQKDEKQIFFKRHYEWSTLTICYSFISTLFGLFFWHMIHMHAFCLPPNFNKKKSMSL
jgi:hypothetical protein